MQTVTWFWPLLQGKSKYLTWIQGEMGKLNSCSAFSFGVINLNTTWTTWKWTLVREWSISTMTTKPAQGKARKPSQPWREVGGGHLLSRWGLRSAKAQAPAGWAAGVIRRATSFSPLCFIINYCLANKGRVWVENPGTLRQEAYPEPRWAHSHSLQL